MADLFPRIPQATECHRHDCEVRAVVRMYVEQGKSAVVDFLAKVEKHRGRLAREQLEQDALAIVRAGR